MRSTPETSTLQFANLPVELVHRVLEVSLEPEDGSLKLHYAWIARVALVSKFVNAIATSKLYGTIQLEEGWMIVLLAVTLVNRPDLAHGVRGLRIAAAASSNQHELVPGPRELHNAQSIGEPLSEVQSACLQLVAVCKNAFLQVANIVFNPNGFFGRPGFPVQAPCYLSMTCTAGGRVSLGPKLLYTTHLHLAMDKRTTNWTMFFSISGLAAECERLPSTAITHVAFDWNPESSSIGKRNILLAAKHLLNKAPNTLQRVTIRIPVFTEQSKAAREGHTSQMEMRGMLALLGDPRVFVSFVEIKSLRAEDGMHELALEGWCRHAHGLEDLWMSGHPVYSA